MIKHTLLIQDFSIKTSSVKLKNKAKFPLLLNTHYSLTQCTVQCP